MNDSLHAGGKRGYLASHAAGHQRINELRRKVGKANSEAERRRIEAEIASIEAAYTTKPDDTGMCNF